MEIIAYTLLRVKNSDLLSDAKKQAVPGRYRVRLYERRNKDKGCLWGLWVCLRGG
jgi:hypothetical protein